MISCPFCGSTLHVIHHAMYDSWSYCCSYAAKIMDDYKNKILEGKSEMSQTYYVEGYIDVRVNIDSDIHSSQSATAEEIAEGVMWNISSKVGSCKMLGHQLTIKGLDKK